jgi:predicted transcriptional regulator
MDESDRHGTAKIVGLKLSEEVKAVLRDIQAEVAEQYKENFLAMVQAMQHQASAISRMQATLSTLIEVIRPDLKHSLPAAIGIADGKEHADIAHAFVVADPIGAGFTMSQAALAEALGLKGPEVSILVRAFKLNEDEECAVVVRRGKSGEIANYHPRTTQRFRELVEHPPKDLTRSQQDTLRRVRAKLLPLSKSEPSQ